MSHAPSHCGNCEAPLTGPYCAQCGQSAHESARSMLALFHDGWHSMTHLDGRLWRTLWLLLSKPGEVSRQFVANRRASFMPPFRLYLVISLVFFGLVGLSSPEKTFDININFELDAAERAQECAKLNSTSAWLQERLRASCLKVLADGGTSLRKVFMSALPRAMFVFLPLLAAGMLLLYWRPRRYYVEHLVFYLHNHSAAFLLGAIELGLQQVMNRWPSLELVSAGISVLLFFWLVAYVYLAMRRFYGQGRWLTIFKLLVTSTFYALAMAVMFVLTALYSALNV